MKLPAPQLAFADTTLLTFVLVTRPAPAGDRLMPKGRAAASKAEERLAAAAAWSLEVAVQRGDRQFRAPSGSTLRAGDQLAIPGVFVLPSLPSAPAVSSSTIVPSSSLDRASLSIGTAALGEVIE